MDHLAIPIDAFRQALGPAGFDGDVETHAGARQMATTDYSIYQALPATVVFPQSTEDLNRIVRAASAIPNRSLRLSMRGDDECRLMATGFSCCCQTERFMGFRPSHPIEMILERLGKPDLEPSPRGHVANVADETASTYRTEHVS